MIKKLCMVIAVAGFMYNSTHAQNVEAVNARLDAMGGIGAPGDIGWVVDKPSYLYAWRDYIQASGIIKDIEGLGKSYGAIIATKSLGKHLTMGLTFNDRRAMMGSFYTISSEFGGFTDNFAAMQLGKWLANWPHLGFCIRPNDKVSIGIGGFLEQSKMDAEHNKQIPYQFTGTSGPETGEISYDSTTVRKYLGIGIIADARIWFGTFRINPEFKMFMPNLDGKAKTNAFPSYNTSHNVTQNYTIMDIDDQAKTTGLGDNMYLRGAVKFSNTINETFWIAGLFYTNQKFKLERSITIDSVTLAPNTAPSKITTSTTEQTFAFNRTDFNWWIACQPNFLGNILFSPEYFGGVQVYKKSPPEGRTADSTFIVISTKIRFGTEGHIKDFWVFDELLPRFGMTFYAAREIWQYLDYEKADSTTIDENIKWPYSTNWDKDLTDAGKGAKLCAGFGLKRGRGSFDISMDILTWINGTVTGPSAALVSFCLDFGRKDE